MVLHAYAKINLYLSVLDRRPDGYHNIESVMQSVSLADIVTVEAAPARKTNIELTITDPSLPCDGRNIAYRAAELFLRERHTDAEVRIHIEKNIPVAGGLAGGSTDGAAVLRGLNGCFGTPFGEDELRRIGASVGADVPFCVSGGTAVTLGIGENVTPVCPLPDCTVLIVRPHESVSTADAYRKIDALPARRAAPPLVSMTEALRSGSVARVADCAYNVFESVIDPASEVFRVRRMLADGGALLSMMSGSGPTVFGIFGDRAHAAAASGRLAAAGYGSSLASPVARYDI